MAWYGSAMSLSPWDKPRAPVRSWLGCVEMHVFQSDRPKFEDLRGNLNIGMTLQSARNIAKLGSKMLYTPVSCRRFRFQFAVLISKGC